MAITVLRADAPRTELPSASAAANLLDGKPGGLAECVTATVVRGALIAIGLRAAGVKKPRELAKLGLAGALSIEAFVLLWVGLQRKTGQ